MLESEYQARLVKLLRRMFPGCLILKNDTNYLQGIPDLLILYGSRWAMLEVKAHREAPEQPNQQYYVDMLDGMSFCAFIYPEIEEEVLHDLQQTLDPGWSARVLKR